VLGVARLLVLPLASAAPIGIWSDVHTRGHSHEGEEIDDPDLWIYLAIAVVLVLLGGAFAGLTIAYMGQDETYLHVIAHSGEGSEKKHAKKVQGLLKHGKHWVLVTLLLSNVITNETLPIVLDRSLGGGWPAVVSSTVLIVIFGEIVPQSICVRYGLSIGAFMTPFVLALMWIMCPVAYPTAKLLDYLLGEDHGTLYKKAGLKTLVQLHKTLPSADQLMEDEVTIISSVLDLKDKPVVEVMTPMQDVFTMSADTILDEKMMDTILSQGYSRIPIHVPDNEQNFIGMLLVKILIPYDPEDCLRVKDFSLATLPETKPDTSCLDILNYFQEGKSHMVLVSDHPGTSEGALGVLTLEDVIEELIGEEIIDESDVFVDVHKAIRRIAPAPKTKFRSQHNVNDDAEGDAALTESAPLLGAAKHTDPAARKNLQTTFLMRRKSSAASDSTGTTMKPKPVRGNTTDMKQHLKHLGPSNAASRPKTTKFASVKIKPGSTAEPSIERIPEDGPTVIGGPQHDDEAAVLQESAVNHAAASDGAVALHIQSGYGTMENVPQQTEQTAAEASQQAKENTTPRKETPSTPTTSQSPADHSVTTRSPLVHSNSTSELDTATSTQQTSAGGSFADLFTKQPERLASSTGDLLSTTLSSPTGSTGTAVRYRRKARSGSITETMVTDAGGIQKYVLEAASSSSEENDAGANGADGSHGDGGSSDGAAAEHANGGEANSSAAAKRSKRKKRGSKKKKPSTDSAASAATNGKAEAED